MKQKYVFTGPMRAGKSALIHKVSKKINVYAMAEVAQYLIGLEESYKKHKKEWLNPKNNPLEFQKRVFRSQYKWESDAEKDSKCDIILMDRSMIDGLAYLRLNRFENDIFYKEVFDIAKQQKYEKIFMCEFIENPKGNDKKRYDLGDRTKIRNLLEEEYTKLGYKPVIIPDMPLEERAELVLEHIVKQGLGGY